MSDNPQRVRYPLKRERPSFEQDGLEILEVCPTGEQIQVLSFNVGFSAPKIPVFRIKSPEVSCQRTNPIAFPQKGWNQAQNPVVQEAVVPYIVPDLQLPPQNPQNLHPIGTACSFLGCTSCIPLQPIVNILPMVLIPVVQRPSQFLGKGQVGPSEQVSATVWQTIIDHCRQNPVYNSPLGNGRSEHGSQNLILNFQLACPPY